MVDAYGGRLWWTLMVDAYSAAIREVRGNIDTALVHVPQYLNIYTLLKWL